MTLGFDSVLGQEHIKAAFRRALMKDRLSHAYLFTGPSGIGKRRMALVLASLINCRGREEDTWQTCGECSACRKIRQGNYPDVTRIQVEGTVIGIDDIREMIRSVRFRPREGRKKVFIVEEADNLSTPAANSMLKILEEPPAYVVIIMLALNARSLPATLVSRCQRMRFRPVREELIKKHLRRRCDTDEREGLMYARLSQGNPQLALEMAKSESLDQMRERVFGVLRELDRGDKMTAFDAVSKAPRGREEAAQFLDLMNEMTLDVIKASVRMSEDKLTNMDLTEPLRRMADRVPLKQLLSISEALDEGARALRSYANVQLSLEVTFLRVHRLLNGAEHAVLAGSGDKLRRD